MSLHSILTDIIHAIIIAFVILFVYASRSTLFDACEVERVFSWSLLASAGLCKCVMSIAEFDRVLTFVGKLLFFMISSCFTEAMMWTALAFLVFFLAGAGGGVLLLVGEDPGGTSNFALGTRAFCFPGVDWAILVTGFLGDSFGGCTSF